MKIKKSALISMILAAAVLAGGGWYLFGRGGKPIAATESVTRGDVEETVSVTGTLLPAEYADLSFPILGRVASVAAAEGDTVQKGQLIATLDASVLRSQLNDANIALAIAVQTEMLARRHWDDIKPEERAAKKLATEQAREAVRTVGAQLQNSRIVAPFDGTLSKLDLKEGETQIAGSAVARVAHGAGFLIEARVPESDIAKVALGMHAHVTFDALPESDIFDAEAVSIDPSSTVVQDVVSYVVKFRLATEDERLREGMTANLDIESAKRENVLQVPFRALTQEGGKTYAEVLDSDGKTTHRVAVETGLEGDNGTVEILSGLKEGDQLTVGIKQK